MSRSYARVRKFVSTHPWAVLPQTLDIVLEVLSLRAEGRMFTDEEIQARIGALPRPEPRAAGTVAVLPLYGVIAPRMNAMTQISGGTSAEAFGALIRRAVDDPGISAIVIDVDSPGGSVFGVEELAATIRGLKGRKPILAVANTMMASAAYWIASQADEIIASPSSQVGSIGVIGVHQDLSGAEAKAGVKTTLIAAGKFKTEGNSLEPLSEEARAAMQKHVDAYYGAFVRDVAKGRGVTAAAVRDGFGEGRAVTAVEAVKVGLADAVGTRHQAIARAAVASAGARPLAAAAASMAAAAASLAAAEAEVLEAVDVEMVAPDEDGDCPDGYELGEDGMCHVMSEARKAAVKEVAELRQKLAAHGS